ncbi:MAG: 2-alkenal reductase, partial [Myxococcaceae bacterium]|nr:2-alkenal reductase [Myxococcaceae bacterium]
FRLPPPREPGAPFIELDVFQGESEYIVDNEYLGSVRLPAGYQGRKIDFALDEECLLRVSVEDAGGMRPVELATRDTPEALRRALAESRARAEQGLEGVDEGRGGLFSSLKRSLFGR